MNSPVPDDGGPAFPVECSWGGDQLCGVQTGNSSGWATGLSLRDWFAGQALAGLLACPTTDSDSEALGAAIFRIADNALAARKGAETPAPPANPLYTKVGSTVKLKDESSPWYTIEEMRIREWDLSPEFRLEGSQNWIQASAFRF